MVNRTAYYSLHPWSLVLRWPFWSQATKRLRYFVLCTKTHWRHSSRLPDVLVGFTFIFPPLPLGNSPTHVWNCWPRREKSVAGTSKCLTSLTCHLGQAFLYRLSNLHLTTPAPRSRCCYTHSKNEKVEAHLLPVSWLLKCEKVLIQYRLPMISA